MESTDAQEKRTRSGGLSSSSNAEHTEEEQMKRNVFDLEGRSPNNLSAVFENPLAGIPRERLLAEVEKFCKEYDLEDHLDAFRKGALISQNPSAALDLLELNEDERSIIRRETTHKWSQPWQLYWLTSRSSVEPWLYIVSRLTRCNSNQ